MTRNPPASPDGNAAHDLWRRLAARWPTSRRRQVVTIVALMAIILATFLASSRLLRFVFQGLDILAYVALFVACWIGAGGGLVPIPGVRVVSWLMIIQQGAALDPVIVAVVAAFAMVLGQTSYFLATRATQHRIAEHAAQEAHEGPPPNEPPKADPADDPDMPDESRRARAMARARRRITYQVKHHGIVTVFVVCALPTPLTTLTTTAASAGGMRYPRFFVAALGGFLLLSSILALFGQGLVLAFQAVFR